jgi:hypothetical protein
MAKADDESISLEDLLEEHPETFVRGLLDRRELSYTWIDARTGIARASTDDGPQPPKGWWTRPIHTTIDRERREVYGPAHIPPFFPKMFSVRIILSSITAEAKKARQRGRPSSGPLVVAEATARLQGSQSADIERHGLANFLEDLKAWLDNKHSKHPEVRTMECKTIGDWLRKDEAVQAVWPRTWRRRRR